MTELIVKGNQILKSEIPSSHADIIKACKVASNFIYDDKGKCVDTIVHVKPSLLKSVRFDATFGQGHSAGQSFDPESAPCLCVHNGFGWEYFVESGGPEKGITTKDTLYL